MNTTTSTTSTSNTTSIQNSQPKFSQGSDCYFQNSYSIQKKQRTTRKNKKGNDAILVKQRNIKQSKDCLAQLGSSIRVQVVQLQEDSQNQHQKRQQQLQEMGEQTKINQAGVVIVPCHKNIIIEGDEYNEIQTNNSFTQTARSEKSQEKMDGCDQEFNKAIKNKEQQQLNHHHHDKQPKVIKKKNCSSSKKVPSFLRQLMSLNTSQQTVNDIVRRNQKKSTHNNPKRACNRRKQVEQTRNSLRLKRKQDLEKQLAAQDSEQQRAIALAIQMSTHAMQNAQIQLKEQLKQIQDTYTYYATEEDIQSPILMIEKLYQIEQLSNWGTIKIVPPPSFKPPCMLDFNFKLPLPTRKQKLEELSQGKGFKQNYKGHEFNQFRGKADLFAEKKEMYSKFEDVQNIVCGGDNDDDDGMEQKNEQEFLSKDKKVHEDKIDQTREEIEEIQLDYWKKVDLIRGEPTEVEYAADLPSKSYGSGFPRKYHSNSKFFKHCPQDWLQQCGTTQEEFNKYMKHPINLNNINNQDGSFLSFFQSHHQEGISGITTPWTYVGMKYATFCWHTEDLMMYSLNYMHKGCAKIWYVIPEYHANKFEKVVKSKLSSLKRDQPNFIHHMTTMVSPKYLRSNGVDVRKLIQRPGEFVITFPRSYHAGFSTGFNIAEAVNFGSNSWLPHGIDAFDIYRKTKEVIPIFSLEWMIYENLQMFEEEEKLNQKRSSKKGQQKCKSNQKKEKSIQDKIQDNVIDLRSESQNESLQFLNDILNRPMKNFRQRGDQDEFASIYEQGQEIKQNQPQSMNKRNLKGLKKQSSISINSEQSLQQAKIEPPFNFQKFKATNKLEIKRNILQHGARVIENELKQRQQLREQMKKNKVTWKQDLMNPNSPYDKYDCSFCTDLPYFSVMIYEGQKIEVDEKAPPSSSLSQDTNNETNEQNVQRMRGKKNRKKKQSFNEFVGSKKPLKSCLQHGHLEKIAEFNKNLTLLIRVSEDELKRKLKYIEELRRKLIQ